MVSEENHMEAAPGGESDDEDVTAEDLEYPESVVEDHEDAGPFNEDREGETQHK
jgi:hypothetical protein